MIVPGGGAPAFARSSESSGMSKRYMQRLPLGEVQCVAALVQW